MKISIPILIILLPLVAVSKDQDPLPPGYPDRSAELDVLPGFKNPPPGYGEVPFWWWSGDSLNTERLAGQVVELHEKGISGVQVNYSHHDTPGWPTEQDDPPIFSEKWWEVYTSISSLCKELGMGIGLSTYTLDWPGGANNLFYQLFYHKEELNAIELRIGHRSRIEGGKQVSIPLTSDPILYHPRLEHMIRPDRIAVYAYAVKDGQLQTEGLDLGRFVQSDELNWKAPAGEWEVWEYIAVRKPASLNPLLEGAGDTVVQGFFQKFQDRSPDQSSEGLNYFFNDELRIGARRKRAWNADFAEEFQRRKGYDLMKVLPALWEDIGRLTPKVRMDYADVRMSLMEERYFKPVYQWHRSRGMIFGCDSGGRGRNPAEFGDYFRATRWYTAPGHDTPGGKADLIKGKVSSSIANLYQRPRVWLEGYHSLGWAATPAQLMFATRENYLYGCTLL
ncbi:MAG TPA: glycosyl hydrolase, partial [Opitutales bacterium]|nr:glycosyl hydrolase [Opitutales bacterium]